MIRQLLSSGHWSFSTTASVLRCRVVVVVVTKDFLVVVVNDTANVRHTAVAYFHVINIDLRLQ